MIGWMAERSKALVSGTSLFGGVGSNPTPVIFASALVLPKKKFWKKKKVIAWSIGVSIPVPRACKARTLPIELMPQKRGDAPAGN